MTPTVQPDLSLLQQLVSALEPFAEPPDRCGDYNCHKGMRHPERCGRCGRAIAAWRAVERAKLENPAAGTDPLDAFKPALLAYVEHYAPAGHFVMDVLRNDLAAAVRDGSPADMAALPAILQWLYLYAPPKSWGSATAVATWVANYADGLPF